MNTKTFKRFVASLALAGSISAPAGTISVVNLPATGTDAATGITANKSYVSAFDYGNANTTTYSVNGVPFTHCDPGNQTVNLITFTDANHPGGQVILSSGGSAPCKLARTSNSGQGSLSSQANGTMFSILTDLIYVGSSAPINSWLQQEYDGLTPGHPYSLRVYYRYWGNAHGDRKQNIWFDGEGTMQPYPNNPLDEDSGGAHYLEYDFTAATTNVFCYMTNLVANGSMMIYAATVEDTSVPYAPFITYQPFASTVGNPSVFTVTSIGTGPLSYQWYMNSTSNYSGSTMLTDGANYSGSTSNNLTFSANFQSYYYVTVSNAYGAVTSSIVQLNPAPVIVTQPSGSKAGSGVQFTVAAGGLPTLNYFWYYNTTNNYTGATLISDGNGYSGSSTSNLMTTTNLLDYYFVVVSNTYGSVTSSVVAVASPLLVSSAGEPIWNIAGQTNIVVTFSDILDTNSAITATNYSLNNSATVLSATLESTNEVLLKTSLLTPSTTYTLTVAHVKDSYGITMSPASQAVTVGLYPANLALWVRADTGVTTDGGGVNQWNDMSGNANNLTQTLGAPYEPQLATNAYGDPVIRFTGSNLTFMEANPSSSLAITGDMSIIAVVNFAILGGGTNGEIVSKTGAGAAANIPAPYDYYVVDTNTADRLYRGNGSAYGQFTGTTSPSIGYPHILMVTETGNTVSHYLDGMPNGSGVLNNTFNESSATDAGQPLSIGIRGDEVNRLTGDISELIIAGSVISSYDAASLETYLVQKHNVQIVNPAPTNIVFSLAGSQLTLSWPSDHIGWQLQSNSIGLSASNAWFTVPGSAATNQVIIPISGSQTNVFYRMLLQH